MKKQKHVTADNIITDINSVSEKWGRGQPSVLPKFWARVQMPFMLVATVASVHLSNALFTFFAVMCKILFKSKVK